MAVCPLPSYNVDSGRRGFGSFSHGLEMAGSVPLLAVEARARTGTRAARVCAVVAASDTMGKWGTRRRGGAPRASTSSHRDGIARGRSPPGHRVLIPVRMIALPTALTATPATAGRTGAAKAGRCTGRSRRASSIGS
jgi:hypothetical protein